MVLDPNWVKPTGAWTTNDWEQLNGGNPLNASQKASILTGGLSKLTPEQFQAIGAPAPAQTSSPFTVGGGQIVAGPVMPTQQQPVQQQPTQQQPTNTTDPYIPWSGPSGMVGPAVMYPNPNYVGGQGGNTTLPLQPGNMITPRQTGNTSVFASPEARGTQVLQMAADLYNQNNGATPYPGARPVGPSASTLAGQNLLTNNAAAAQALLPGAASALGTALTAPNIEQNPFAMRAIDAALGRVTNQYTDPNGVLANIRGGASGAGQYGGSRQGIAEGIAAREYGNTMADTAANMATTMYGQGLDTMTRGIALAPTVMQAGQIPASMLSAVGTQQEGFQQANENYRAEADTWNINQPWQNLSTYASFINGSPQAPQSNNTNNWLQAIGGGLAGWGLGQSAGLGNYSAIPAGLMAVAGFGG